MLRSPIRPSPRSRIRPLGLAVGLLCLTASMATAGFNHFPPPPARS